jgi:hypothetical protein
VNKKSILLSWILLLLVFNSFAQGGKVLVLKDRGVSIKNFTVGNYIRFEFSNQQWITGYISRIDHDTVDVKQFALQQIMTGYGTTAEDTLKLGTLSLHINEIRAFAKDKGHFNSVITNGALLKTAGVGYIFLNVANSLIRKDPVFESGNIPKLLGGVGAWVLGKIQQKSNPDYRPIGKRFSVEIL